MQAEVTVPIMEKKSVFSEKLQTSEFIDIDNVPSAVVVELSPLIRTQAINAGMSFLDLT